MTVLTAGVLTYLIADELTKNKKSMAKWIAPAAVILLWGTVESVITSLEDTLSNLNILGGLSL